jgi:hypothetical protein
LISPQDVELYTLTDSVAVACETIRQFYRVYHSSRYVQDYLVLRLRQWLSDDVSGAVKSGISGHYYYGGN